MATKTRASRPYTVSTVPQLTCERRGWDHVAAILGEREGPDHEATEGEAEGGAGGHARDDHEELLEADDAHDLAPAEAHRAEDGELKRARLRGQVGEDDEAEGRE